MPGLGRGELRWGWRFLALFRFTLFDAIACPIPAISFALNAPRESLCQTWRRRTLQMPVLEGKQAE